MRISILIIALLSGLFSASHHDGPSEDSLYLSPGHICLDKEAGKAYISLSTASRIAIVDLSTNMLEGYIPTPFNPGGLVVSKERGTLYFADKLPEGKIHLISLQNHKIFKSVYTGHTPDALAITPDETILVVANRFSNSITLIDLNENRVLKNIPVDRDPKAIAISPDGQFLAVANNIPNAAATDQNISAKVSLINLKTLELIKNISLANGSQSIEGICFSKDGKYIYASHILSRNTLPTTQIERGWINSNAVSIIRVENQDYYSTVLLDNFNRGAANPSGMIISDDGSKLFIALSGVHEICTIDLAEMHKRLKVNDHRLEEIPNDFRFLNGIKTRTPTTGKSPRDLAFWNEELLVSSYFSTKLEILSPGNTSSQSIEISLGQEPEMNSVRRGELLFRDADLCFQKWQSCLSCHPDVRSDGLNWDLLNDGAGSPKNSKSLLYSHFTPPSMITGIRESAEVAVRAGIKYALFTDYEEKDAKDLDSYLMSLKAVPSPYLISGKLSKEAKKGKKIFDEAGCISCHSGKYHTDGNKYDVRIGIKQFENFKFDVPTLSEIWRTAPYLYDGRAKTMEEVFTQYNPDNKHGNTINLSEKELDYLVEYVLSL